MKPMAFLHASTGIAVEELRKWRIKRKKYQKIRYQNWHDTGFTTLSGGDVQTQSYPILAGGFKSLFLCFFFFFLWIWIFQSKIRSSKLVVTKNSIAPSELDRLIDGERTHSWTHGGAWWLYGEWTFQLRFLSGGDGFAWFGLRSCLLRTKIRYCRVNLSLTVRSRSVIGRDHAVPTAFKDTQWQWELG